METNHIVPRSESDDNYLTYNSPPKSTNGDLHNVDFLKEFFPELTIPEVNTLPKNLNEMQQEETMMNGHGTLIDDVSIQNEKLKLVNKELKEKIILQESQIAKYEVDLSEKMQYVLTANQELETVKEKYEKLSINKEKLDKDVTQWRAQVDQLLQTREEINQANQTVLELQKEVSSKEKALRRLRLEFENINLKVSEKNGHVRKMRSANKKLWNMIMEIGVTLSKNGLLTQKKKDQILKEIVDQISAPDCLGSEGENIKAFWCGLNVASVPVESSNSTQLDNRIHTNNSSDVAFGSSIDKQQNHYTAVVNTSAENCITSNMKSHSENCITSNVRSYGSNYFMKTHKDVIEDLVSEDFNELNNFRQQLSVRNEPISPLPVTPPPHKSAKLLKTEPTKSSIFAGKKLNFFHQQSESFEVQNVESVEKPPLMNSTSTCATPTMPNLCPYTISSKLNHDGSLKLDFSANYDTHLSFDLNTRKVSCTVMPSAQIQTDCLSTRDSSSRASPSPISPAASQRTESLSNHSNHPPVRSSGMEAMHNKRVSTCAAGIKKIGTDIENVESLRNPKKVKLDNNISKNIQKPVSSIRISSSPKQNEKDSPKLQQTNFSPEVSTPFSANNLSHEKKTLNDIGRSGKIYSAFVSPSEKRVTIPSVRVSPRQLKVISPNLACEVRPVEMDTHLQSSATINDRIPVADNKSPNKRKKRTKKIKNVNNSKDLLQLPTSNNKIKNRKVFKKRKVIDFKGEKNNAAVVEENKCSDNNNGDESIKFEHNEVHTYNSGLEKDSPSPLKSDRHLQKDSFASNIETELNTSPPKNETSDPFKVPSAMNVDVQKVKSPVSNLVEKLPDDNELCEVANLLIGQVDNKLNNDIDFSDIQVSPFNPSTFVSRGLFTNNLEDIQKPNNYETNTNLVSLPVDASHVSSELVPTCIESPLKESLNDNCNVPAVVSENKSGATNSDALSDTLTNGHLEFKTPSCNDGLESDHSLVIAEDADQNVAVSDSAENSPSKSEATAKKKFSKKKPQVKKCSRKKESPEIVDVVTISAAFRSLEQMKFTDMHFKQNQHTLVNALINPNNASDSKDAVYQVLRYLVLSRASPFTSYFMSNDETVLIPLAEKCIVQALLQISRKKKSRLHGLLFSAVNTAYELILTKESLPIYGLSSLCRVLTEICRCLNDKNRPLMLCSELLKFQHKFAPYLIASIAGVWKDLFSVSDVSDEETIFHSSIVYGTLKKPTTLNDQQWKQCSKVLSMFLSAQLPHQINGMVNFLVQTIEDKCVTGSLENEYILTTPLVVFTAVEGWDWAKEVLIDEHIIPNLVKFSEQEVNEKAFAVFCQLYADVCYFCPNDEDPHEVFGEFFMNESEEESEFVKNAAAMAQIRLFLQKKQLLPEHLTEWIRQIQNRPDYVEYAETVFRRRLMFDIQEFSDSEVL